MKRPRLAAAALCLAVPAAADEAWDLYECAGNCFGSLWQKAGLGSIAVFISQDNTVRLCIVGLGGQ